MCLTAGIDFSAVIFMERSVIIISLIQIKELTFGHEGSFDLVFEDASIQLDTDWKLGFTGRNGRGKTTLLKLLAGEYGYQGAITASVKFSYFPFAVTDESQLTLYVAENFLPDMELWQLKKELSMLGLAEEVLYRPYQTLSNGERTKILLAILFLRQNNFLLIDEPTNHLDLNGRRLVADYLNEKNGFLVVSHDRMFLDHCTDHILSLQNTGLRVERGNFSSWYANQERRSACELAEHEKLQKQISRMGDSIRRTAGWSDTLEKTKTGSRNSGLRPDRGYIGHQSAKMMKRSKAIAVRRESALDEKQALLKDLEKQERLKLRPLAFRTDLVMSAKELSLFYGEKQVCAPFDFTVKQGERIALTGENGCGKSTLFKLILGEEIRFTGQLIKPGGLILSYVAQDSAGLSGDLRSFCLQKQIDESLLKTILRKLDFTREQFEKPLEHYSLGQKKKTAIAASLCQQAHLYLWDEPLNYIDVISRMQIEELLSAYRPTILFVEHDAAFVKRIATKTIEMG